MRKKGLILLCGLVLALTSPVYADEQTEVTVSTGDDCTLASDGQSGSTTKQSSEKNTDEVNEGVNVYENDSTKTGRSSTGNQHSDAYNASKQARDALQKKLAELRKEMSEDIDLYTMLNDNSMDLTSLKTRTLTDEELCEILNLYQKYKGSLENLSDTEWSSINQRGTVSANPQEMSQGAYQQLTDEEKDVLAEAIATDVNGNRVSSYRERTIHFTGPGSSGFDGPMIDFGFSITNPDGTQRNFNPIARDVSGYNPIPINSTQLKLVRPDLTGLNFDLYDSEYWNERMEGLQRIADESGFPYDTQGNFVQYPGQDDIRWQSNVMVHTTTVGLLTDYHLTEVERDAVTSTDYSSNRRRWIIYKDDTTEVATTTETDNPRHDIDFKSIYEVYGAGRYTVIAEQFATVTRSTKATYRRYQYLVDMNSGMILSSDTSQTLHPITLPTSTTDEWIATGDTFIVNVNDLGQAEFGDGGIERTE